MSRLLGVLLRLYPPSFRRRFGAEMALVLRESARADRRAPPTHRTIRHARLLADVLLNAGGEWWSLLSGTLTATRTRPENPGWARLRSASPQRTSKPEPPPFTPLPELRRRHAARTLPPRAASMI